MTALPTILLGETPLSIHDVDALAGARRVVDFSPEALARVAAAREVVEAYAEGDEPIYGLNTGLGGNIGHRIDREAIRAFQAQLVRGRCIGVGEPLPEPVCRAALLARLVNLAAGGSGMSQSTARALLDLFNRGVTPVIPARGTVSAGDLGLAAHMGAVVIGGGEAWLGGERLPGAEALRRAGLAPAALEPKDGLALCSHSSPSAGHAAVTLARLGRSLLVGAAVAALSFEAYGGNGRIFDARLHAARPAAGQVRTAALFQALLAGSSILDEPRSVQDALCFRCLAPIMGTAFAAFDAARRETEVEINAAPDSPLVLPDDRLMLSTPNFHMPSLGVACDALAIAMVQVAAAATQRVIKLMTPSFSRLPKYLSTVGGASAGYVPLQKTAVGLFAEIRQAAMPASLDAMPVSDGVEDLAPLTLLAIRKLAAQVEVFDLLVAVEALVAAQAADLRDGLVLSPAGGLLHDAVRMATPRLGDDREAGPDVMAVLAVLAEPGLPGRLAALLPPGSIPSLRNTAVPLPLAQDLT